MPRITYNQFYKGVAQDDFLTNGPGVIEQKNINGLQTGYGAILGPKPIKIRTIPDSETPISIYTDSDSSSYVGTEEGKLFKIVDTDTAVAVHDFGTNNSVGLITDFQNDLYCLVRDGAGGNFHIYHSSSVTTPSFTKIGETTNKNFPNVLQNKNFLYIAGLFDVHRISKDARTTVVDYNIVNGAVSGMSFSGTRITIYTRSEKAGSIEIWDGDSQNIDARLPLSFVPTGVTSYNGAIDYITAKDGDVYIVSGFSVQRLSKKQLSNRGNDNSGYKDRLTFEKSLTSGDNIQVRDNFLYLRSNEEQQGIYAYDSIIDGLQKGFHKICTTNYNGDDYDSIGAINYNSQIGYNKSGLYIASKSGSTGVVEYIPDNYTETQSDGYFITEVFSGGTSFQKKGVRLNIGVSNTGGSNFCKIYKRINNGSWVLIKTINKTGIHREELNKPKDNFIDIQFKVELHNESELLIDCPIFHELTFDYEPTEKS